MVLQLVDSRRILVLNLSLDLNSNIDFLLLELFLQLQPDRRFIRLYFLCYLFSLLFQELLDIVTIDSVVLERLD